MIVMDERQTHLSNGYVYNKSRLPHIYIFVIDMCSSLSVPINCKHQRTVCSYFILLSF